MFHICSPFETILPPSAAGDLPQLRFCGTMLLTKVFTKKFLTQPAVREIYAGTNQGIMAPWTRQMLTSSMLIYGCSKLVVEKLEVSMGICSLHAQAEGCRFMLLYMEYKKDPSFSILIPVISGLKMQQRAPDFSHLFGVAFVFFWWPRHFGDVFGVKQQAAWFGMSWRGSV